VDGWLAHRFARRRLNGIARFSARFENGRWTAAIRLRPDADEAAIHEAAAPIELEVTYTDSIPLDFDQGARGRARQNGRCQRGVASPSLWYLSRVEGLDGFGPPEEDPPRPRPVAKPFRLSARSATGRTRRRDAGRDSSRRALGGAQRANNLARGYATSSGTSSQTWRAAGTGEISGRSKM